MIDDGIEAGDAETVSEAWRRVLASVAGLIVAFLLVALVILVAASNRARDEAQARERHSYDVMVVTRMLDAEMARAEAALGRFVISGEKNTGALYSEDWRHAGRLIDRLAVLTASDPRQVYLVGELRKLYLQRGKELADPAAHALYRQGWPALSTFNRAGKSLAIPRTAEIMERIAANERAQLDRRSTHAAATAERSNQLAALLSGTGLLLVLGAIALGWAAVQALAERRRAIGDADAETRRAGELERAVAERTQALTLANERLRAEADVRAAAEARLAQAQKMDAVGQLTGGIAHDFNNMLAVVVGGLELARRRLPPGQDDAARHIDNAMEGAVRAAALTRRLLAFARAEPLLPEGVDPARLLAGMADLLDRALGERIRVDMAIEDGAWPVWCDPSQLENAILNLAVNACDAMDGEGRLAIAATNVTLRAGEAGEAPAGAYLRLAVTDEGCGMTPELVAHVFEPFFTTKPVGKGTGLGLSQIFGFARQSGGDVAIRSAPGRGTTVSLYLPRSERPAAPAPEPAAPLPAAARRAGGTILVVEDDPRVRAATTAALEELGHVPVPCAGGAEAIALLAARGDIDLILTDVVMPGMTGPELIARAAPLHPGIAVLYVSGYVGDAGDAAAFGEVELLRKPFTVAALDRAVAAALARGTEVRHAA